MQFVNFEAKYLYRIKETIVAGIILEGWEVKAIKLGNCSLKGSYCYFDGKHIVLKNCNVSPLKNFQNIWEGKEKREKKLLVTKKELKDLEDFLKYKGNTVLPLKIFISEKNLIKAVIGKALGNKNYNKKQIIKERELDIEAKRELKNYIKEN